MQGKKLQSLSVALMSVCLMQQAISAPLNYESYAESWPGDTIVSVTEGLPPGPGGSSSNAYENVMWTAAFADYDFSGYTPGDLPPGLECSKPDLVTAATWVHAKGGQVKLSFGGATYPITSAPDFSNLSALASDVASVINDTTIGFTWDGVDFDIECNAPPGMTSQEYATTLLSFLQQVRALCPHKIISLTFPSQGWGNWEVYLAQDLASHLGVVDYINFMEYDIWIAAPSYLQQIQADIVTYTAPTGTAPAPNNSPGWGLPAELIQLGLMTGTDDQGQVLLQQDAYTLAQYAVSKGLYGVMTWDLTRDSTASPAYGYSAQIREGVASTPSPSLQFSGTFPVSTRQVSLVPFVRQPAPNHGAP